VLARARRFVRRQLYASAIVHVNAARGVGASTTPVVVQTPSSLNANVSQAPLAWVTEACLAAAFLSVLASLDVECTLVQRLTPCFGVPVAVVPQQVFQVRRCGVRHCSHLL
jgi:hypothetical protein